MPTPPALTRPRRTLTAIAILLFALTPHPALAEPTDLPAHDNPATTQTVSFPLLIRPADRVLFIGDQVTQQMFYTRATAAALLAMMPEGHLRFFNGGRDGATAATTSEWADDLLQLTQPTVVTIAIGNNDALQTLTEQFEAQFTHLVQQIKAHGSVRQVVLLGTLPVPSVGTTNTNPVGSTGPNHTLKALSRSIEKVALDNNCIYVDLFDHMHALFTEAIDTGGEPLTFGGHTPNEQAHVVIASLVLRGFGVTAQQLDAVQWSPLRPVEMRRVRRALALPVSPADLDSAGRSRAVYQALQQFDERFFRQWRLSGPNRHGRPRQSQAAGVEQAWAGVQQLVASQYTRSASAQ